jgi:hypothetical protein
MAAPIVIRPEPASRPSAVGNPAASSTGATVAVVRGALWANDLRWLPRPEPSCGDYALSETCTGIAELAAAMEVDAALARERLERGCRAFVARSRTCDAVVSWVWASTGREYAPPIRQDLHFAGDESYGWDAGTLPPHRGRGLFCALLRLAGWRLAQDGRRWMWGGIVDSNLASRRACAAAGYRPVLRVTAVHEPASTRVRVRPADYADPELVRRAQRVLGAGAEVR